MTTNTVDVDLTRTEFWLDDPHPTFAWLRAHEPVLRHRPTALTAGRPFWALTRYDDIARVSRDAATFCSGQGVELTRWSSDVDEFAGALDNMATLDDPEHRWMRALVSRGFGPRTVHRLAERSRQVVTELLDEAAEREVCDFATDIAGELPMRIISEMIGIPDGDRDLLRTLSGTLTGAAHRTDSGADGRVVSLTPAGLHAWSDLFDYLAALERERARAPRDDLMSVLLEAQVDGRRLTAVERRAFFVLLWFAGHDTVRTVLAGGLVALRDHPEQRARLLADPGLVPTATEEMIRWTSPLTHFRRTATTDTELGGRHIAAGDWVVMYYGSGNRDERRFTNPDRFDIGRDPNPHLGFGGGGPHFCLGAPLARLQIRTVWEELLRRFPDVEIVGPVERARSSLLPGIRSLPVALGAPAAGPGEQTRSTASGGRSPLTSPTTEEDR